jgi:hypothetical protein
MERVDEVNARSVVDARTRRTLVDVRLTVDAGVARNAQARVVGFALSAHGAVVARLRRTVVGLSLAVASRVAVPANALVRAADVATAAVVAAQIRHVHSFACSFDRTRHVRHVASTTGPPRWADAFKLVGRLLARSPILTHNGRRTVAPINELVAVLSFPSTCAHARVLRLAGWRDATQPVVETGVRVASGQEVLAMEAGITGWTTAGVSVDSVVTCPSVQAQTRRAVIVVNVTVRSTVSPRTRTSVRVNVVVTRCTVGAWR